MKGFTLVELIVSLALVAIITLIGVMNFTDYNEKKLLQTEVDGLAQELQELKVLAFSGQKINSDIPEAYCLFKEQEGYKVFADMDGDLEQTSKDELLKTIEYGRGVQTHWPKGDFRMSLIDGYGVCFMVTTDMNNVCGAMLLDCGENYDYIYPLEGVKTGEVREVRVNMFNGNIIILED
jgi:prepilin-type N-terminal cleavage/methylation domain-containing protein